MTNMTLTAIDRPTLVSAHGDLAAWITQRRAALEAEVAEQRADLDRAAERKWATKPLEKAIDRAQKHILFLDKVSAALAAGYSVIPNLNLDVLAVRTDSGVPHAEVEGKWSARSNIVVGAKRLPVGHGDYVDPSPELESWTIEKAKKDGSTHEVTIFRATQHAPVDVPFVLMKRDLSDALHRALEEKIFDEIGIVRDQPKGDPVLVGRIRSPKASGRWNRDGMAFFIGWWFDPSVLEL